MKKELTDLGKFLIVLAIGSYLSVMGGLTVAGVAPTALLAATLIILGVAGAILALIVLDHSEPEEMLRDKPVHEDTIFDD